MKCGQCGNIIKKESRYCPFCGIKISRISCILVAICAFFLLGLAPVVCNFLFEVENMNLIWFIIYVILINVTIILTKKANTKIWVIFVSIFSILLVTTKFLAPLGFPKFIRTIGEKDFTPIFVKYSVVVVIFGIFAMYLFCKRHITKYSKELVNQEYNNVELININNFSRYRIIGYYILKLKLDGIIKYDIFYNKDIKTFNITLSNDIKKVKDYCEKNLVVKPIIDFLEKRSNLNDGSVTTIRDIIENVEICFEVEPTTKSYDNYKVKYDTCKSSLLVAFLITISLIFIFGYSKVSIGMYFGEEVYDLTFTLLGVLLCSIFISRLSKFLLEININNKWSIKINEKYNNTWRQDEFEKVVDLAEELSEYEKDMALKKFIITKHNAFYKVHSTFLISLFSSVYETELRYSSIT